jgi:hypothetical protein
MRAPFVATALAACGLALAGCHAFEREGRQQRATFTTSLTPQQTRAAAEDWLGSRALYTVTSTEPGFVRAEKRRPRTVGPGEQIDIVSARFSAVPEGTEVELLAITDEVAQSGARNRADQVSPEAIHDIDELARVLMPRP